MLSLPHYQAHPLAWTAVQGAKFVHGAWLVEYLWPLIPSSIRQHPRLLPPPSHPLSPLCAPPTTTLIIYCPSCMLLHGHVARIRHRREYDPADNNKMWRRRGAGGLREVPLLLLRQPYWTNFTFRRMTLRCYCATTERRIFGCTKT